MSVVFISLDNYPHLLKYGTIVFIAIIYYGRQDYYCFWWRYVIGYKSNCSFVPVELAVWLLELFLNKCGYVKHHYLMQVFFFLVYDFANDLIVFYVFIYLD